MNKHPRTPVSSNYQEGERPARTDEAGCGATNFSPAQKAFMEEAGGGDIYAGTRGGGIGCYMTWRRIIWVKNTPQ